ncbi:hypothetical protein Tco_0419414 [Tanacetum coccineum]
MAALKLGSKMLDYWREYFRSSNCDIFETIEKAIMVAASDYPKEFRISRDCIAQTLYNCKLIKCIGCDKVELGVIGNDDQHEQHDDVEVYNGDGDHHQVSDYNYGVVEALTDEIEKESLMFGAKRNRGGVGDLGLFHCDGSHVKHNKATRDNVGPLLLKRQ